MNIVINKPPMISNLDNPRKERKRSEEYIRHAEHLLRIAEEELISNDGHLISTKGLIKLRDKLKRIHSNDLIRA